MKVFEAINATIADLRMWRVLAGVIMPDHTRWIVSPAEERGLSVGDFSTGFKRSLRKTRDSQSWEWQRRCFDRLLRSDENLHSAWIYVQDNPVRQGLVQKREDWPCYVDFINCKGSSQLPLQTDPGKK
jgi:REP element-mobilizing transposase RayT